MDSFSPFPPDQLAWGFHGCPKTRKILIFATPFMKLRQLGWQNLEFFRRVFPSFVSLVGKEYERPSIVFLLHDETLTAASFEPGTTVPDAMYSLPVDATNSEEFEAARGKLLSHFDLAHFDNIQDVLSAGEVSRTNKGFFKFESEWWDLRQPGVDRTRGYFSRRTLELRRASIGFQGSGTKKKKACCSPLDGCHGVGGFHGRAPPCFHSHSNSVGESR